MASAPDTFRVAATWGDPVYISWVVRPGNPKLLASVNGTIARLADSGQLAEMQQKWVGTSMAVPAEATCPKARSSKRGGAIMR